MVTQYLCIIKTEGVFITLKVPFAENCPSPMYYISALLLQLKVEIDLSFCNEKWPTVKLP